ncbi:hypothetical protein [Pseudomonas plecoglossicida]|uniref:hypothetical protein n=1 Tax=Pseudomonas plecoglossicida TaxID=70775 RepID=UPI000AAB8995|nr:hypothetical protein [Pseudomonas plecoglossicida]
MKVRTLARLSGPAGNVEKGEEVNVTVALGAELIQRKLAEPIEAAEVKPPKTTEPK